jgi:Flp pilus assembly protein TadD
MMLAAALVLAALFQAGPTHGSAPTSLVAAAGPRVVQRVVGADPRVRPGVADLEEAVQRDPENLKLAAEYRQLVIASGNFDRSIDVLQKLAKRQGSGPNVHLSLALAYVDKVPPSGDIRRLYLGRDAIGEATKAIERQPSVIAYYIRGL